MKKVLAMLLTLVMILALPVTSMAENPKHPAEVLPNASTDTKRVENAKRFEEYVRKHGENIGGEYYLRRKTKRVYGQKYDFTLCDSPDQKVINVSLSAGESVLNFDYDWGKGTFGSQLNFETGSSENYAADIDFSVYAPGTKLKFTAAGNYESRENDPMQEAAYSEFERMFAVVMEELKSVTTCVHLNLSDLGFLTYDQSYEVTGTHRWDKGRIDGFVMTNTCTVCGAVKTSHIHKWNSKYTVDVPATCKTKGEKSKHCLDSECAERKNVKKIKSLEHKWGKYITTMQPTINSKGVKVKICKHCEVEYAVNIAKVKPFIKLSDKKKKLTVGQDFLLTVKCAKGDSIDKISWDKMLIEVSPTEDPNQYVVTAVQKGNAKITVSLASHKKASCKIKVKG